MIIITEVFRHTGFWNDVLWPALWASLVSLLIAVITPAYSQSHKNGAISASLDTTLSYGFGVRVQNRDKNLIAVANGGAGYSSNIDDGNQNYNSGDIYSNLIKGTTEAEIQYKNTGVFVRGTGLYDFQTEHHNTARTKLTESSLNLIGSRARILDAFGWYQFDIGSVPGELRVGNQVLSWGESTFIQNGISSINPVNVNALRVPGSELKEALLPVPMAVLNVSPTQQTSVELFYQWDWQKTEIDPVGSYFSILDPVGRGADRVILGRGSYSDGALADGTFHPVAETFLAVPRAPDRDAGDSSQFGAAFHWLVPQLNDTEFGFFIYRNHSRLPLASGVTGTAQGAFAAGAIQGSTAVPGTGAQVAAAALTAGVPQAITLGQGLNQTQNQATVIAQTAAAEGFIGPKTKGAIVDAASDAFTRTAYYRLEYPEDIKTYGISFNSALGVTGWALQGEVSYRQDVPVQINTIEIVGAVLGAINPETAANNQVGSYYGQFETDVPGFARLNILQFQTTATKNLPRIFGADNTLLVGELGVTHILDYPSKTQGGPNERGLRLSGPNTELGGNPALVPTANQAFANQILGSEHFVSETSWGYQILGELTYNNAIGAINLKPRIAWRHDVNGVSPGPGENFLEGNKAISIGLAATYLSSWRAEFAYTNFFGAGKFNVLNDRDFTTASLSYSF
jgi:hypothetical protein